MKTSSRFILIGFVAAVAVVTFSGCATKRTSTDQLAPAATVGTAKPEVAASSPAATASQITLTVVKVDSEETSGEDGKGANAVDGDTNTFWHTQWQDANPEGPHEIIIKLTPLATIKGFTYLPRQDDSENGTIRDYEFYVSNDGVDFGQPVRKGSFENSKDKKIVTFEPRECQFIKLKALSEVNGEAWTSAAEIGVIQNDN
ncbi:MAG TPA: discoidin domain-containing protein [Candidatus Acidoferrum sp.]|nr:discoidin domain-containing protein [Candidatus Acidoferrum sp.]